jgi:multidrug resistance efflux pump
MQVNNLLGKLFVPSIALVCLALAAAHALYSQRPAPSLPPPVTPSTNPFGAVVAGTGFVEPSTDSSTQSIICVGSQLSGIVAKIAVHLDQVVQAGDLLFELDKRQTEADLQVRKAAVVAAEAQLDKLKKEPRPEEVPPSEAQVRANEAVLRAQLDVRDRDRILVKSGAVTNEVMVAAEQAVQAAQAQVDTSQANLALLKAGAWDPDKVIAAAAVQQAQAQVDQAMTQLALLEVRAPVTGTILQVNVRLGEAVAASPGQSLIVMGNLSPYHVRVSIDEEDIPRLKLNAPARAKLRGDLQQREISLQFVRIEPYVIPKTSLTGDNTERVDTRVMQLIYSLDATDRLVMEKKVLVGQLLDVFIDVK